MPVATTPKYINDIVDSALGFKFQGFSKIVVIGINIIVAQIKIDAVTFSFFFY